MTTFNYIQLIGLGFAIYAVLTAPTHNPNKKQETLKRIGVMTVLFTISAILVALAHGFHL